MRLNEEEDKRKCTFIGILPTLCDYWQNRVFLIWVKMEIHRVYVYHYWRNQSYQIDSMLHLNFL